jgi:hypothetical protein
VGWAQQAMEALIQALLYLTTDTCTDLCAQLPQGEQAICGILCDVVGIKEFIKILNEADLDPIYYCQRFNKCEADPNGMGNLLSTNIVPRTGQRGNTFAVNVTFQVSSRIGAGEFMNVITSASGEQEEVEAGVLFEFFAPGSYNGYVQFGTQVDAQSGITWHSGQYDVQTFFCMGQCGSAHPYSKVFGYHNSTFTLKNESDDDQAGMDDFIV